MVNRKQKLVCILQLCFTFSLFLWLFADPFMGDHFRIRHDLLLIENIRGDEVLTYKATPQERVKLESNRTRYNSLPLDTLANIHTGEEKLLSQIESSFLDKASRGLYYLLVKTPFFILAYIFFGTVISILCLKGWPGATASSLILPLIVILYAIDISSKGPIRSSSHFPTEKEIVENYLPHPLSDNLMEQQKQLLEGFDIYLIRKWAKETPSTLPSLFIEQRDKGEFEFNLAILEDKLRKGFEREEEQEHFLMLLLYFVWNSFFFMVLVKDKNQNRQCIPPVRPVKSA